MAVIGAGASGLVAARELRREGHTVVVFERGDQVGGVWVYTPDSETDPLGLDPNRNVIHCSLYNTLRTNLPREVMGFRDYPFVAKEGDQERDQRRFPGHKEVLMYLKDFAKEFEIEELVRFETEVIKVKFMVEIGKWKVETKKKKGGFCGHELFDAVVVCAGHYWEPLIAEIPGICLHLYFQVFKFLLVNICTFKSFNFYWLIHYVYIQSTYNRMIAVVKIL